MINLGIMKFHNVLLDIDVDKPEPLDLVHKDLLLRFLSKLVTDGSQIGIIKCQWILEENRPHICFLNDI